MQATQAFFVGAQVSRERLKDFLATSPLTLVGASSTLAKAHSSLCNVDGEAERPDILLVDIHDRLDGDEAEMLRAIRRDQPAMKIIVLGDSMSLALFWQSCQTEINGYLRHTLPPDMLMHALDVIMSGQQILPACSRGATPAPRATAKVPLAANATNGISAREAQILQQLVGGSSNKAIARDLAISHETVKVHIKALLRKLRARNRTQVALWGIENGFVRSTVLGRIGARAEAIAGQAEALSIVV